MRDSSPNAPSTPQRVLFVDDDDLMRQAFVNAMRPYDYEVDTASSGSEAVARVQGRSYPVVVSALRMPGIDGLALIEQLCAIRPDTAFVIVSSATSPDLGRNERIDSAIASVLEKPLDIDDLVRTIAHAFEFQAKRARAMHGIRRSEPPATSVLVVEDNPGDADLLIEMLRGFHVSVATRLSEALRLVHDRRFETIITDVALPDARGIDAVMRLQASCPDAAIIAISSLDDDALAHQMIQLGAQDYLLKQTLARRPLLRSVTYARERKRAEQRLLQLAHYDQLTGLANRTSFYESTSRFATRARRMQQRLGVMLLDLDGFKMVNDSYGHDAGDILLQEVSHRMRQVFREYDVVARLGGDEFAVLVSEVEGVEQLAIIAQRLLTTLSAPTWVADEEVRITASIGIALFPDSAESITELLKCADAAMYQAKKLGKNGYHISAGTAEPPQRLSARPPPPVSDVRGVLGGTQPSQPAPLVSDVRGVLGAPAQGAAASSGTQGDTAAGRRASKG
jgi:two-component system cell cycle response regulator